MIRKNCIECPWVKDNNHNIRFREYSKKMKEIGKIENHSCHMINKDVWGYNSDITDENVCIGSKTYLK